MTPLPTLIVISGPPGAGKTTLAHALAAAVGCPAVCRDEIKEGMVHAVPGFTPAAGDELTMRALGVFFEVVSTLVLAGVTTVAEAAFQDHVWRQHLTPLLALARVRVVHAVVEPEVALRRVLDRHAASPVRRAHADRAPADPEGFLQRARSFRRLSVDVPFLEVDTSDGYQPSLTDIAAFVSGPGTPVPPAAGC